MGWTSGTVKQDFKIRMDIEKLIDFITERIEESISSDKNFSDVSIEADFNPEVEFNGSYETDFRSYYARATRYEPEEFESEREWLTGSEDYLLKQLPEPIRNLISIEIIEREDDADYQVPEPDEDRAYDEWRDRQLEED